jgi:phosphatidylinositol-3,4,5-trisphosphate 3-phosphatase/dual-specificity protein phosphatase PTEN
MNYIRTLVSGKKKRFVDRKFNLDLSYITPRIIAMAYPGSGIETVYRNDIDSVHNINKGF